LDRTLVYTAVTRAQQQVIIVGDVVAARKAVEAVPKAYQRQVALGLLTQQQLEVA
jgi:exodeoxyribonuclease V alpha subunit